ncbi:MAG: lipid II:glycine glycyltransferase FemX [Spirochaetota bacterium]
MELEPISLDKLTSEDNLFQSSFWGAFKAGFGWKPIGFFLTYHNKKTTLLVLTRKLSEGKSVAYVPYGPDIPLPYRDQGHFLEVLSRKLNQKTTEELVFIRYDLRWETPYARENTISPIPGDIRPPAPLRELRINFDTREHNLRKAPTNMLPADTVILDIRKPSDKLLAEMKPKTRYNIRLSKRRGVKVNEGALEELPSWYNLYQATARRHGILQYNYQYFLHLLRTSSHFPPGLPDIHLILAGTDQSVSAGAIVALHGKQATYLYGASSRKQRRLMPTYALQWRAINLAKQQGCTHYDFFGIPPTDHPGHPMAGLYRFKTGFGGSIFHRRGCWDYPVDPEQYRHYRGEELSGPSYHS